MSNKVLTIIGPTASGKSSLALLLAKELNKEIISADSRQIYRYLDIGTAKPTKQEQKEIKHHLIDELEPDDEFNAGLFAESTLKIISDRNNNIPIICGGTGFYIKSFFEGIFKEISKIPKEIREELNLEIKEKGVESLYRELLKVDKESADKNKELNPQRIIRALEYYRYHQKPLSLAHKENNQINHKYQPVYLSIRMDRNTLYDRINNRALKMWEDGLIDETQKVLDMGYSKKLNSLNTVGYKEAISYLEGSLTKDLAISEMQKNTRRYAKRQLTWNRKINNINYIDSSDKNNLKLILKIINEII